MVYPQLSIIIPTHNRPQLLPLAVHSALHQSYGDVEVVVVDDGSSEPVRLPADPRLRIIRLDQARGGAAARNVGTQAARGHWVTYLDDDDVLLPHMAAAALDTLAAAQIEAPVGLLSGLQKVNAHGEILGTCLPPTCCPRGSHFFLEPLEPGRSFNTKQTLVVERDLVLQIGGWAEGFRSRVHSEFFLRLNPVCTLIGLPQVTYQLRVHGGARVSGNPALRQISFEQLVQKHQAVFADHPQQFATFVYEHARKLYTMGQMGAAWRCLLWSLQLHPAHITMTLLKSPAYRVKSWVKAWAYSG